jgi:hypothetical protein
MSRIVCHFSCGAASAVATKIILTTHPPEDVVILNAFIKEEHEDNRRFLADCERWFAHPVTVLRDDKYGASVHEVWRRKRFLANGVYGAPCSAVLKREVIDKVCLPDDIHVLGYTIEERHRMARFEKHNQPKQSLFPLIARRLSHADCLSIIERAGIELPLMYRLGFNNANCIGCCKGGEGYWNKVRRDFPDVFNIVADIQESIGPGAYLFRDRKTGVRFPLRQLDPTKGRHKEELPSCSFLCQQAEEEIELADMAESDSPLSTRESE